MSITTKTLRFQTILEQVVGMPMRPPVFILILLMLVMAACGGGGGPPPSVQCANGGGDWNGLCCTDTVNPGYTSPPCAFNSGSNAYCGKNRDEHWQWAPAAPAGAIYWFPYCLSDGMLLGNGTTLIQCGGSPIAGIAQFPASGFVSVNSSGKTHEYYCSGSVITECRGEYAALSSNRTSDVTGDSRVVGDTTYYCASDADWTADLDTKDNTTCIAAGFTWTGGLCCSDANHPGDYYNDPTYPNAIGGCWNQIPVASGDFAPGATDRVINYHGRFFGCHITEENLLSLRDTHTNEWLINKTVLPCATALMDAQPGGLPNAVCQPDGLWKPTDDPVGMINKSIIWAGLVNLTGISASGCCGYDQCWNGTKCQVLDSHYRIGDQGFVCKVPPAAPVNCVPQGCIMPACMAQLSPECAQASCIPVSCFSSMANELCITPGCAPASSDITPGPVPVGGGAMCTVYPDGSMACVA